MVLEQKSAGDLIMMSHHFLLFLAGISTLFVGDLNMMPHCFLIFLDGISNIFFYANCDDYGEAVKNIQLLSRSSEYSIVLILVKRSGS